MAYKHSIVPGHEAMLDEIRRMAVGWKDNELPVFTGTGNGWVYLRPNVASPPTETWAVTCTSAAVEGAEVWSVVGSVSGAQASATTGVPYSNSYIDLDITANDIAFQVGDVFTCDIAAALLGSTEVWTEQRYDLGVETANENKLILMGQGLTTNEEIYVGIGSYKSIPSDYYNLYIAGFTGFNDSVTFDEQPGWSGNKGVPMYDALLEYWLCINAQRIVLTVKAETVYESFYLGKFFPYGTPAEYPYPLAVMAPLTSKAATRYSDTAHHFPFKGSSGSAGMYVRRPDGSWEQSEGLPYIDQALDNSWYELQSTPTDEYPLLAITPSQTTPNIWGELDGVWYVPGFSNEVENIIQISGEDYMVVHDVYRTGLNDYFVQKLV